jgi:hypothetical protein
MVSPIPVVTPVSAVAWMRYHAPLAQSFERPPMRHLGTPTVLDFDTQISGLSELELEVRLASSRTYSGAELRLAASLIAYVSEDDSKLPRDQFLRMVLNRIVDHLSAPLPHSP